MNPASQDQGYGGLAVAGLSLALPILAVREVLPALDLLSLPSVTPGVVGGIDLRGVVLPVLDLALLFGQAPVAGGCVLVMVHDSRLLGLRVDGVTGIFAAQPGSLRQIEVADPRAAVYQASLRRTDTGGLVSLLSPAALCALPGMPLLEDPEPGRQQRLGEPDGLDTALSRRAATQVLLVAAAGLPLAIDAMAVYATVAKPQINPSPLRHGICRGVTEFAGRSLPVVDLLELCGLQQAAPVSGAQSFLIRVASGLVCLLVDQVIDVVNADLELAIQLPGVVTPQAGLFSGMLPATALPDAARERAPTADGHYLLLNGDALQASPRLNGLAAANAGGVVEAGEAVAGNFFSGRGAQAGERALLVYDLHGRTATPLAQIREILPWSPGAMRIQGQGALLAVLVNRNQTIPVLSLAGLLGLPEPDLSQGACVLVVDQPQGATGFAVAQLYDIVLANWESSEAGHGFGSAADGAVRTLSNRAVAMIGGGPDARLLRVLDLEAMAAALAGSSGSATAPQHCTPMLEMAQLRG